MKECIEGCESRGLFRPLDGSGRMYQGCQMLWGCVEAGYSSFLSSEECSLKARVLREAGAGVIGLATEETAHLVVLVVVLQPEVVDVSCYHVAASPTHMVVLDHLLGSVWWRSSLVVFPQCVLVPTALTAS